jgi:3',5'-nucleoside bisphosphate phosphatase
MLYAGSLRKWDYSMKLKADLHIHTALSPCGDNDMTPNNIVNMAKLKGLQAIAITDHNCIENVVACMEVGSREGLIVIPGMELQTKEEVHVICLFTTIEQAIGFQSFVYENLPDLSNNEKIFGEQFIIDDKDNIIGKNKRLLLTSTNISLDDAFYKVTSLGGVFIPAHIDKSANGIIENLGFIPDYLDIRTLEYRSLEKVNSFIKAGILKNKYRLIKSSDAHYLEDILENENEIECKSNEVCSILQKLNETV